MLATIHTPLGTLWRHQDLCNYSSKYFMMLVQQEEVSFEYEGLGQFCKLWGKGKFITHI
jgi:hypothetical protein